MEIIIGIITAVLVFFGLMTKKSNDDSHIDLKEDKVNNEIDVVEDKINDLEKNGVNDLNPDEVVDYWKDK